MKTNFHANRLPSDLGIEPEVGAMHLLLALYANQHDVESNLAALDIALN